MTRGPTSRVTISSASPLLRRRLFFQPWYSIFSTAALPFSAARRPGSAAAAAASTTAARASSRPDHSRGAFTGIGPHGCGGGSSNLLGVRGGRVARQVLAADDGQVQADLHRHRRAV